MRRISRYILLLLLIFVVSCQADSCNDSTEQVLVPTSVTDSSSQTGKSTDAAAIGPLFLTIETPSSLDLVVDDSSLLIEGETRVDALLTVGDDVVEPGIDGKFSHELALSAGHNQIEIIASISSGEQEFLILSVIYED